MATNLGFVNGEPTYDDETPLNDAELILVHGTDPWLVSVGDATFGPESRRNGEPLEPGDQSMRFDGAGNVERVSIWNGAEWSRYALLADSVLVPSSVGTVSLADGAVTAPIIKAGTVNADHMRVGALDAFRIRSPLFESVATANRGIKWVGSEFVAWNNSGQEMFRLSGNTGEISGMTITGGVLRTAASGQRFLIGTSTTGNPGMWVYDSANTIRLNYGFSTGGDPGIWMNDASGTERLVLGSQGTFTMNAPNGKQAFRLSAANDASYARAYLYGPDYGTMRASVMLGRRLVDGTDSSVAEVNGAFTSDSADASWLRVTGGGSWWLGSSTRGRIVMDNSSGELYLYPRSNLLSFYNLPATTSSGQWITMIVSASGRPSIYRNTSLRAAKTNIVDLDSVLDVDRLMDLRPRVFHDRTAWEQYAKGLEASQLQRDGLIPGTGLEIWEGTAKPKPIIGLIAEEVVEVFPELASWDGDGSLSGVQYDRLPELILAWLQKHWPALLARVEQLERQHNGNTAD